MFVAGVLIRAAAGSRPSLVPVVHIWRHFAVLTNKPVRGQKRDHLFLRREGWRIWKSWKFKVVYLGTVFETGTMTGLMTTFR